MRSFIQACLATAAFAAYADYDNTESGKLWGAQGDDENSLCQTGVEQSPINLTNGTYQEGIKISMTGYGVLSDLDYKSDDFTATQYTSETIQDAAVLTVVPPAGQDEGKGPYYPLQFHFHAPSENAIDGELKDAEMHIVHTNDEGELAVIGVLFEESEEENAFLAQFQELGDVGQADLSLISDLDLTRYWTFKGSLTTPPCTEGLRWTVLKQVQPISADQLAWFLDKLEDSQAAKVGSNRVLQELNDRVLYDSEKAAVDEDEPSGGDGDDDQSGSDFSVSLVGSAIGAATVALLAF